MKRKLEKKKKVQPQPQKTSVDLEQENGEEEEDVCSTFEDVTKAYELLVTNVKSAKQIAARSASFNSMPEDIASSGSDNDSDMDDEKSGSEDGIDDADGAPGTTLPPFKRRYECTLAEDVVERMSSCSMTRANCQDSALGNRELYSYGADSPSLESQEQSTPSLLHMKEKLRTRFAEVNKPKGATTTGEFTDLQRTLYRDVSAYRDVFYHDRNFENGEEIRRLYCLHVVNHIWKTRSRIVKNNAKLAEQQCKVPTSTTTEEEEDCRDQGLTRPKVLILVPFRDACLKIVNLIIKLASISGTKSQIMEKKKVQDGIFIRCRREVFKGRISSGRPQKNV